jgi:hypothetical protein
MDNKNVIMAALLVANIAVVAYVLVAKDGASTAPVPASLDDPQSSAQLLERIEKLESELVELKSARPSAGFARGARPALTTRKTLPAGNEALKGVAARQEKAEDVVLDVLDAPDWEARGRLEEIVSEKLDAERESRWQQRSARMKERVVEHTKAFATDNGLDDKQERDLTQVLAREQEDVTEFFRQARADMNFELAREQADALREETDKEAADILDAKQFEAYKKDREEEGTFPGRRRGR